MASGIIEELLTQLWEVNEGVQKEVMAQPSPKRPIRVSQAKRRKKNILRRVSEKGSWVESECVSLEDHFQNNE